MKKSLNEQTTKILLAYLPLLPVAFHIYPLEPLCNLTEAEAVPDVVRESVESSN